jgi:hypothetical protein
MRIQEYMSCSSECWWIVENRRNDEIGERRK